MGTESAFHATGMRRLRSLVAALAVSLLGASCLAPTLPLPPPEEPTYVFPDADASSWTLVGSCEPGALVLALNTVTNEGVLVQDATFSGSYTLTIDGSTCDLVELWQKVGNEESALTGVVLEKKDPADPQPSVCQ